MNLIEEANSIVRKLKSSELTQGDLRSYFTSTQTSLQEVRNVNSVEEATNVSTPFLVMLANEGFTANNYLWQTICAQAYYSSSHYIQTKILDEFNIAKPERLIEYVQMLMLRLMILLNGKRHFPDLIFRVPSNPNTKHWTPLSGDGASDSRGFNDMVMADAGLISKFASPSIMGAFQQENLQFANSVLSDNKNLLVNVSIEEVISKGLTLHKLLFNYLDSSLTRNGKLDFHSDDDE